MSEKLNLNGAGHRKVATREMFRRAAPITIKEFETPELGEGVVTYLRMLTPGEKNDFDARGTNRSAPMGSPERTINEFWENHDFNLLIETVCDEHGNRILDQEDASYLKRQYPGLVRRLYLESRALSGYADLNELRVSAKNFGTIPTVSSPAL